MDFLLKDEVNLPGWLASFYQLHFRKESLANDRLELLMDENNILWEVKHRSTQYIKIISEQVQHLNVFCYRVFCIIFITYVYKNNTFIYKNKNLRPHGK